MTRGDFSRFTFDPANRYSVVVMQQGRMQIDADWNEQQSILAHRIGTTFEDLIGGAAAPEGDAGFELTPHPGLTFCGDGGYVELFAAGGFGLKPGFTVEFWFRLDGPVGTLIALASASGEFLRVDSTVDGRPACTIELNGVTTHLEADQPVETGRFHHLAVVHDTSGATTLYVDGEIAATGPSPDFPDQLSVTRGALGASTTSSTSSLSGSLQDVKIWHRPLSGREVAAPRAGARDNDLLTAWWRLADGAGSTTAADSSPDPKYPGTLHPGTPKPRTKTASPVWGTGPLRIGPGRFYVDGLMVENPVERAYDDQPDLPNVTWPLPKPPEGVSSEWYVAYLDVWERTVTAEQRKRLADVALGGADPSVRLQSVAQVKLAKLGGNPEEDENVVLRVVEGWRSRQHRSTAAFHSDETEIHENLLYRVEIHRSGPAEPDRSDTVPVQPLNDALHIAPADNRWDEYWAPGAAAMLYLQDSPHRAERPTVVEVTGWDSVNRMLTLRSAPPELEASVAPRLAPVATFKWSRSNASVTAPIATTTANGSQTIIALKDWGLAEGQLHKNGWVEIITDQTELTNLPNPLVQIASIERASSARNAITVTGTLEHQVTPANNALLVLWDCAGANVVTAKPTGLGSGISVSFDEAGRYEAGQFWQCPARVADQSIDWPAVGGTSLLAPAAGPVHARGLLAVVEWDGAEVTVMDRRMLFSPARSRFAGHEEGRDLTTISREASDVSREGDGDRDPVASQIAAATAPPPMAEPDEALPKPPPPGGADTGGGDGDDTTGDDPHDPGDDDTDTGDGDGDGDGDSDGGAEESDGDLVISMDRSPPPGFEDTSLVIHARPREPGWRTSTALPDAAASAVAIVTVDELLYVLDPSGKVFQLDDAKSQWNQIGQFAPRSAFRAAVHDGWIHIVGGTDERGSITASHVRFSPSNGAWDSTRADPPTARRDFAMAIAGDGLLHVVGGATSRFRSTKRHEVYSFDDDTWVEQPGAPRRRSQTDLVRIGSRLVLPGGAFRFLFFRHASSRVYAYDTKTETWARAKRLPGRRRQAGVTAVGSVGQVIGGRGWFGRSARTVFRYDAVSGGWSDGRRLHVRARSMATTSDDSATWVAGGKQRGGWRPDVLTEAVATELAVYRRRS